MNDDAGGTDRPAPPRGVRALIRRLRDERRALGWAGLLRKRGWKLVLGVVLFYLVRDVILYVLIPLAIVAGLLK